MTCLLRVSLLSLPSTASEKEMEKITSGEDFKKEEKNRKTLLFIASARGLETGSFAGAGLGSLGELRLLATLHLELSVFFAATRWKRL